MANNNTAFTPVFPSVNKNISENLGKRNNLPIFHIKMTPFKIVKEGETLHIGENTYNIKNSSIQDVALIMLDNKLEVTLYTYNQPVHFLSALLINDFDNTVDRYITPNSNPVPFYKLLHSNNLAINATSRPTITKLEIFENGMPKQHKIIKDRIFYKSGKNVLMYYTLTYRNFNITLSAQGLNIHTSSTLYRVSHIGEKEE